MHVDHLQLTDFRNYREADVDFARGPNLFVGRNGQGKTNLVESIGYLSTLGSHRVPTDAALVRQGCDAAIVRARLAYEERTILAEVQINRTGSNRAQVNRAPIKPRDLPRYCTSVLFAPEDLALVRGEPAGRRRMLDELLVLIAPRMQGVLADYDRTLRQRNTLLKSARGSGVSGGAMSTLDVWDDRLVALGSEVIAGRDHLVRRLAPFVAEAYAAVAGAAHEASLAGVLSIRGGDPETEQELGSEIEPVTVAAAADGFRAGLARRRRDELDRGLTLVGPHRDDVLFRLNGLPARGYASHGESWSFALAVKLAAAAVLRAESSLGDPIIVLDDVFAELDETRRGRLANAVSGYEQVLITAAVHGDVPPVLAAHTVHIDAGRIVDAPGDDAAVAETGTPATGSTDGTDGVDAHRSSRPAAQEV
ncbi:DNA replication/repair protein RecF [Curtobacterium sp. MCBD17_034]|uniref:DNA replication/repair protein RecF n=1 Tax=unclassified Curtobacterium TaxID=257496 RepID=UPI000DA9F757|nr:MULTISPECIES: DNA replication/repair protein RecF [unclassified Curtobacterium]PZF61991.1 DNA replication/repair protein RecF [Curtobacterium sp. MCBD17_034]PZM34075.1 DNA replication/repair protein RecF [Curtobacterium sp. MCBD17_031]